jgi:signal transduction histidine kinase/ActR/RegA family two-component response regulator
MKPQPLPVKRFELITRLCGLLVTALSSAALIGWFVSSPTLRGIRAGYIPMAPNTALLFILLGTILAAMPGRSARVVTFARAGAIVMAGFVAARLCEYATGIDLGVDQWVFHFPAERLGLAPVGKMAFFTASTFLLLSGALLLLTLSNKYRWAHDVAQAMAVIVTFVGLAFSLGYCYGAPLMYGGVSIPMALNTATAFFAAGVGLLVRAAMRDATERRRAQAALQAAHDELELRVSERTSELARTVASLEAEIAERSRAEEALRASEEQLRQAQKLEAVGQLAGGVAHDFNNLLTVITGYSDLMLRRVNGDESLRQKTHEIKHAAERAAALTRQLLAFSRKQVLQPKVLDLNSLVADTSKLLRRLIGEDIELILALKAASGRVLADPSQVEQVMMNLVVNARDAMPQGGKITIQTANVELDEAYAGMHIAIKPGAYLMLAVSDTGAGMDSETRAHIFEPFFTTKEVGKGTGLGLSTVYGIVKQSGGNIWVYSEVGQGTTFKIYLPRVAEEADARVAATKPVDMLGTETVLLVEDEEMVRKLTREILQDSGYRVLEATNGEEALRLCQQRDDTIHLLLTDVVMPLMSGRESAERIASTCPAIKVLYMSGYTDDAIVHHGVLEPGTQLLEKPFTADILTRRVREVLDAAK